MIQLSNLDKRYDAQVIFKNTNYIFPTQGLVCLLGESGCGKTTLFNLIAGFDTDYEGNLLVCGRNLHSMKIEELCQYRKENIGFVFQNYHLLSGYTVYDNILLACSQNEFNKVEVDEQIKKLLDRVDMLDKINEKVEHLSGGQKQRVAIVRALINEPSIILADEPTGALDHKNAVAIMELLKELAHDHLVLMITHDASLCEYGDEILQIQDGQLISDALPHAIETRSLQKINQKEHSSIQHAIKNFKLHMKSYILIAFAIVIGTTIFTLSLSSGNLLKTSITDFQQKNTAFNNGQIKVEDNIDEMFDDLQKDERLKNIYKQYILHDISLSILDKEETMIEKYPMSKSLEHMSYGIMPREGYSEIALSPSLAKKFGFKLDELIGKTMQISFNNQVYEVQISGIYGASYDDFYVSSDIEQQFYKNINEKYMYSISFDVKEFEDIVPVYEMLNEKGIEASMAYNEVKTLQSTFHSIQNLFLIVSILILSVAIYLSAVLLIKIARTRLKEIGLLSALGYRKKQIKTMLIQEHGLLILIVSFLQIITLLFTGLACQLFASLSISIYQVMASLLLTPVIVFIISLLAMYPLLRVEPAKALRA